MALACPHGPDEPCTCKGCGACAGHKLGCTCDIDWDEIHELVDASYRRTAGPRRVAVLDARAAGGT